MSDAWEKRCSRCGETKPVTEFGINRRSRDGLRSECLPCKRASDAARRVDLDPEKKRLYTATYLRKNRAKLTEKQRAYRAAHPEKYMAWMKLAAAVKVGRLTRPMSCERCGTSGVVIEASHDDYSRPFDVEWLCVPCHREKDGNGRVA